jgi:hypothetical protein
MMQITKQEYSQYMFLLEQAIKDYAQKINGLYISIDKLQNNNSIYGNYEGSLGIEDMYTLAESFILTQQEYFKKWYKLNKALQLKGLPYYLPGKYRGIGQYIKGVTRYTDLITSDL